MKKVKYTDPQTLCKECGWQTWLFLVEVVCRCFPVWITLSSFGIVGNRAAVKVLGHAAERSYSMKGIDNMITTD